MVNVSKGDLIKMEYTGKVASTGQVFETTDEGLAKKLGILDPKAAYGPKLAIFGKKAIMKGMEEAIELAHIGKSEDFLILPENAFGKKEAQLIRMLPLREFAKHELVPEPGMVITLDGVAAKVKSVTSGRVVVDFNHPLAGESVLYSLKVHEVITDPQKKIEAILGQFGLRGKAEKKGEEFTVAIEPIPDHSKEAAAKEAIKQVVEKVKFTNA